MPGTPEADSEELERFDAIRTESSVLEEDSESAPAASVTWDSGSGALRARNWAENCLKLIYGCVVTTRIRGSGQETVTLDNQRLDSCVWRYGSQASGRVPSWEVRTACWPEVGVKAHLTTFSG